MSRTIDLDPVDPRERSAPPFVALVRCSRAHIDDWIAAAARAASASRDAGDEDAARLTARVDVGEDGKTRAWTLACDGRARAFASIAEEGEAMVARGTARPEGGREGGSLRAVGAVSEKLRPKRSLEDGTARRVKMRGEEELREKRERHVVMVDARDAPEPTTSAAAAREDVKRDVERWTRLVAASAMSEDGGEFARLKGAVSALLHERPLSENAMRECVARGFAAASRRAPGAATVRDAIKQVATLRPPGRYELLGHVRRKAKERHDALTAAAREMRLPRRDVRTTEAPAKTTKAAERATKTSSRGEPSNADGSVPTPPLQEPPKVLKNGVTVDLGDRSPSLDLEPHTRAAPGAARGARDITERVPGDDDDDWRDIKPSPHVDSIDSIHEFEALKAVYDTKYGVYLRLHATLALNADEYERVRRGDDAIARLERFATLRTERYAAMRDVFDALHGELAHIRSLIDGFRA